MDFQSFIICPHHSINFDAIIPHPSRPRRDHGKMIVIVTQFNQQPTSTRPEKAFFAESARELIQIIGFTRWLGIGAVVAVGGLVANAVMLVVRGRVRGNAVLRTLGFPARAIAWLVMSEGGLLGLMGGAVGVLMAVGFLRWQALTIGNEGQTLAIQPDSTVVVIGLTSALVLGLGASVWPACKAMRQPIIENLR